MAVVGYARVSSTDQDLGVQEDQLKAAGCTKLFMEKRSGTNLDRPEWEACLQYLRDTDTLVVTRLDRLARSMGDLFKIIDALKAKGVDFRVIHQPEIDTTTPNGRLMLGILACIAEFETAVRSARQREGIDRARAQGKFKRSPIQEKKRAASYMLGLGQSFAIVSQKTGIPQRTLYDWFPQYAGRTSAGKPRIKRNTDLDLTLPPSAAEAVAPEPTPETPARKAGILDRVLGR
jgi:DNA invertase Pin-like site-specific DNA recombinase